jgi:hypothetical protein
MQFFKEAVSFVKNLPAKYFEKYITEQVNKRYTAAVNKEEEDKTWRRITDVQRKRDLPPLKHDKMIRVVDYLNDRNPIAKKVVRLTADFVVGEGIQIKADEVKGREKEQKELQKIIDKFWTINEWDLKQFDRIEELSLYGEQIYRTFINEMNGDVKLGVFDPEMINKILPCKDNAEELTTIIPKGTYSEAELKDATLDIIRPQKKIAEDKDTGKKIPVGSELRGEAFFFAVNKGSHATRGKSDLLAIADWLDIFDRTLYTMTERVTFLLTFIWDITINGATPEQLKKRLDEIQANPPKPGSHQVHNDMEAWKAHAPDLKGRDYAEFAKSVKDMLTGGSGYPEHWLFGKGEDVNKASAQEMAEPTLRQLQRRQQYVIYMFRKMIDFQIQQKINKDILDGKVEDYPYSVVVPDPSRKETTMIADAISKLAPALAIGTTGEFISTDTAMKTMAMMFNQMGLEVKAEDEAKKVDEGLSERIYKIVQEAHKNVGKKTKPRK